MGAIAYQITSPTVVYPTVYSETDQRKHQSSASLAFVRGIHRGPVNSPHKWPVTRKTFPFDEVIINFRGLEISQYLTIRCSSVQSIEALATVVPRSIHMILSYRQGPQGEFQQLSCLLPEHYGIWDPTRQHDWHYIHYQHDKGDSTSILEERIFTTF